MRPTKTMYRHPIVGLLAVLAGMAAAAAFPPAALAQMPAPTPNDDPNANFPPIPTIALYDEVKTFRTEIEGDIAAMAHRKTQAKAVVALVDTLVAAFDRYGNMMDREHGDFPNMSRGRPYWIITTDDAADTLTDRVGPVIEAYIRAHPDEKLGEARALWEIGADRIGLPRNRIFGFQFVELARRASTLRTELIREHPANAAVFEDSSIRFLWDLVQFYRQLHATWYDRHMMRVADEDWIIHRIVGRCKEPKWQTAVSMTAIGVDTTAYNPMTDKFMHRLKLIDPACPDTVDFVVSLPHYRLMERELNAMTPAQRDSLMRRATADAEKRGEGTAPAPGKGQETGPEGAMPRNAHPEEKH